VAEPRNGAGDRCENILPDIGRVGGLESRPNAPPVDQGTVEIDEARPRGRVERSNTAQEAGRGLYVRHTLFNAGVCRESAGAPHPDTTK
jgi:hypothetical protein